MRCLTKRNHRQNVQLLVFNNFGWNKVIHLVYLSEVCISKSVHRQIHNKQRSLSVLSVCFSCTYTHWTVISSTNCTAGSQRVCVCVDNECVWWVRESRQKIIHIESATHSHVCHYMYEIYVANVCIRTHTNTFPSGATIQKKKKKTAATKPSTHSLKNHNLFCFLYFASSIRSTYNYFDHFSESTQKKTEKPTNETVRPKVMDVLVYDPRIFVSFCLCAADFHVSWFSIQFHKHFQTLYLWIIF